MSRSDSHGKRCAWSAGRSQAYRYDAQSPPERLARLEIALKGGQIDRYYVKALRGTADARQSLH
jgi:hypothetical protein